MSHKWRLRAELALSQIVTRKLLDLPQKLPLGNILRTKWVNEIE